MEYFPNNDCGSTEYTHTHINRCYILTSKQHVLKCILPSMWKFPEECFLVGCHVDAKLSECLTFCSLALSLSTLRAMQNINALKHLCTHMSSCHSKCINISRVAKDEAEWKKKMVEDYTIWYIILSDWLFQACSNFHPILLLKLPKLFTLSTNAKT